MGGAGSGRRSVKGEAIGLILNVQIFLNKLINEYLDSNMTREQLKEKALEVWQETKKTQEELERL